MSGYSVCCRVHGFKPYFHIACPPGIGPDDVYKIGLSIEVLTMIVLVYFQDQCSYSFCFMCICLFQERMRKSNRSSKVSKFVHHIELVQKKSIMYYQQQKSENFLKIVIALPSMESTCLGISPTDIFLAILYNNVLFY